MTKERTAIDDLDDIARELVDSIVNDVRTLRKQVPHPALSRKLTGEELWERYGQAYVQDRENPEVWKMTLEQMGESVTLEFGQAMEKAMQKMQGGENAGELLPGL